MRFLRFSQTKLGSSLSLPAHGWVGARATLLFLAAHFAKQNTNSVGVQSEGEAEGGWGEFRLARAEAKPRRPARSEQSPAKKFSFPFKRKRNRAPNQKMRRKLFCGTARETSGGGAERSKFAVRIFVKKSSDFVQQTPPY